MNIRTQTNLTNEQSNKHGIILSSPRSSGSHRTHGTMCNFPSYIIHHHHPSPSIIHHHPSSSLILPPPISSLLIPPHPSSPLILPPHPSSSSSKHYLERYLERSYGYHRVHDENLCGHGGIHEAFASRHRGEAEDTEGGGS